MAPRIIYSPHYDIRLFGLERLHPFDTRKYSRAYALLRSRFGHQLKRMTIAPARPINESELLSVHTPVYLKRLSNPDYLARALEVPQVRRLPAWVTRWCILRPMRWATMGTILGAREAMKTGLAINLGGGYHHASQDAGEGFCIYSDIALAVADLRQAGLLSPHQKVVYIDLDAHQGNGVCHVFFDDSRIFIFDMYNGFIYPGDTKAKRRIDCPIALPINCGENDYMRALQSKLPGFLDALARAGDVAFAIYNAGTDIVRGDTLGLMNVSESGVLKRDIFVLDQLADRKIPTLMLTSGGYTRDSFRLIAATLASLMDGTDLDLAIPPVDELKE